MSPAGGPRFDIYRDSQRKWHWKLLTGNATLIAVSPKGFSSKQNCVLSLRLVADAAHRAPIWNSQSRVWEYG